MADGIQTCTAQSPSTPGQPLERLEVEEPNEEDIINWPSGHKLWLNMASVFMTQIVLGLDLTIVAIAVPSLTNQFHTVADIGWYSAAYGLTASSFNFFFGKLYSVFSVKKLYIISLIIFEAGSLLCTVAPNSPAFICGRAIAGIGNSAIYAGLNTIITHSFPNHKRPLMTGLTSGVFTLAMVSAPLVGGALIDAWSWRLCFGINLPLGVIAVALTAYGFQSPIENPDTKLPLNEKIKRIDAWSTLILIPGITCLLLALQWGGTRYGWNNAIIIVLLVASVVLIAVFSYLQYRLQDKAALPPRILKKRSILAGAWFNLCINGALAITEQYLSIYFQGVKGYTAVKAGILGVPLIIGLAVGAPLGGAAISLVGYYSPFMLGTTVIAPIAAGLLTTIELDESNVKILVYLGILGFAVGLGLPTPTTAVQTILNPREVSIGIAIVGFGGGMGSAMAICASAALFQNRLVEEARKYDPGINTTWLKSVGLSDIRKYISPDRLRDVLIGYDKAVVQTLYMPMALTILTLIASAAMEWRSVKKKQS